ncbi:MAG: trigger factor, partial [Candidatus Falkowbacteria bacterium]|nr:trigger factor [Candidatus Falkowbacteria bacterium]
MKVTTKDLPKSQIELQIELTVEEFKPYIVKGANSIAKEIKVDGFRPGKAPYELVKAKIGEMTILEEAARIAIAKVIDESMATHIKKVVIGQPQISITKLAPENPLEFKVIATLLPELTIGKYKDLKLKKQVAKVEEKEIDDTILHLQEMRVVEKITEAGAKEGDKVLANINMYLDNVPVDGGQSKETVIIIG